jgi:adenylate cyclase
LADAVARDGPLLVTSALGGSAVPPQDYKRALARQTLLSERMRAVALSVVLCAATLALTVAFVGIPGFGAMMPGMKIWTAPMNYWPFVIYELAMIIFINRRLAKNQDMPVVVRYLSALIETSLPSVILLSHVNKMGMVSAFGFIAPLLYSFFIILSTLRLNFWLAAFTGAVAAAQMFAIAYVYLPAPIVGEGMSMSGGMASMIQNAPSTIDYHLTRSAVLLAAGVIAGWVAVRLRHQFEMTLQAVAARDTVTNLFGQHVSPQVVDRLLATGGEKGSEIRRVAIMFVDIRGFTAAAQNRAPRDVVSRLDSAFTIMVEVIDSHGGVVNKFLGDGFLAIFGAPLQDDRATLHAVAAGCEMLRVVEKSNASHPDWPIRIGIGLHVGDAVTGIVGSPRRKEYTVIGDTVNLAARIEGLNKEFGSQFLLSEAARSEAGEQTANARPLGDIEIRGHDKPISIWQLA